MIISAIKSLVKNLTDNKLSITISSHLRLELSPKGTDNDTAKVTGDIFTHMERTQVVEAFTTLILEDKLELTYIVDSIVKTQVNEGVANINSGSIIQDKVTERNKAVAATVKKEEPKQEEPVNKATQPETEIASVKLETQAIEQPVEEPKPEEPVEEPKQEEPVKARKPRQIKAN